MPNSEMRMSEIEIKVPQKRAIDYLHTLTKTAIASVPRWWAGTAAEIFSLVLASPIEKRRDEFLEDIAWVVRETAAKVGDLQPENLINNEAFISATLQAARIAMGTHQQEKRRYLRNALLNIAIGKGLDEVKQHIFLNAIEVCSPAHVKALDLIWRGAGQRILWDENSIPMARRTYATAVGTLVPELKGQLGVSGAVFAELRNRGFSNLSNPDLPFPQGTAVTGLGVEFLHFVLSPEDLPK
jgi:hypothetical protein